MFFDVVNIKIYTRQNIYNAIECRNFLENGYLDDHPYWMTNAKEIV